MTDRTPEILFVCVHNAGRSQMAARFATALSGGRVRVASAGSAPAERVNPVVAEAMAEVGLDLEGALPRRLTDAAVHEADVVITMGCGDACPFVPGKRYLDWVVEDPAGRDLEAVRGIRDDVRGRVERLLSEMGIPAAG
jgi:arsenate reductase (thioredoxin)